MSRRAATALITGVTGQDGVHLARLLLAEGVAVVGTHSPGSVAARAMAPYLNGVALVPWDLRDHQGFADLVRDLRPDEVYHLAALSSVGASWHDPEAAVALNGEAPAAMLGALAAIPEVRFLQAGSVEETGPAAASPYARGKLQAREAVLRARDEGRFCVTATLHPHESPLRRPQFVVRKVCRAAAEISLGQRERLALGSVEVRRDWGAARDYVAAMPLMLRADRPADQVIASGVVHGLREVVEMAFEAAGVADPWDRIDVDTTEARPIDSLELSGDPEPVRQALGWEATTPLQETVAHMVDVDRRRIATGVEEDEVYLTGQASPRPFGAVSS